MRLDYDVIVIGAGHAGCEAACAAARMGSRTLLITMDMDKIAQMSCNPAVGGIAKGQIVREIDALGGRMGIVTDLSSIQFRMLNRSKGPAMWSPRAQCDRARFSSQWRHMVENEPNLRLWQDSVARLDLRGAGVRGVTTALGVRFDCRAVVLTAGTFLNGLMHVGRVQTPGGRVAEPASSGLTEQLAEAGLRPGRMKTGTPVRIDGRTVDYSQTAEQQGDNDHHHFSFLPQVRSSLPQRSCWITCTNERVHSVLRASLDQSPLYNGQISAVGPRYCPSIETKIVTFADKDSHQLFIEPESADGNECYLNGFSSSLPWDVQFEALRQIPALKDAHFYRPGYAIEYDYFDPTQLDHCLQSKLIDGLYLAGQVNGTTGYEEAAGQGLVAGVNAHLHAHGGGTFELARDEAYIGVLIDDLVTKGVDEPYRMFTSRAEHRILLRQDNADIRLTARAHELGLAGDERMELSRRKTAAINRLRGYLDLATVRPADINAALEVQGLQPLQQGMRLRGLVLRPQLTIAQLADWLPELRGRVGEIDETIRQEVVESVEIAVKYAGYIERERQVADKLQRLEQIRIKGRFDYASIRQISTEGRQKLAASDPETIGQATRIPGISPSDINILLLLLGR